MAVSKKVLGKAINDVVCKKGHPYSKSEFNGICFEKEEKLKKAGATKKQIEHFNDEINKAPIIGGRFNKYSGD